MKAKAKNASGLAREANKKDLEALKAHGTLLVAMAEASLMLMETEDAK